MRVCLYIYIYIYTYTEKQHAKLKTFTLSPHTAILHIHTSPNGPKPHHLAYH